MSGRRRRYENSWDKKEEKTPPGGKVPWQEKDVYSDAFRGGSPKWSNSEANGGMTPGKPSWEGNRKDDNISRDRYHKMQTDPSFDNWEEAGGYGRPYRGRDRGASDNLHMSRDRDRDRERNRSPYRSRSRGRVNARAVSRSRSRSRSRGRDWETTRGRSRSPFRDDKYRSNEYGNNQRPSSQPCKNFASGNCRRGSHCKFSHQQTLNSRHDSYRRDDRNGEDHRRQFNRNSRAICKFFAAGNCNRNDCRFSHDAPPQSALDDDERPRDNNRGRNPGRTWDDQQQPRNASDFGDKNKSWSGATWGDYESGGFDQSDDKKNSWNGPTWDEIESGGAKETSHHKKQGHNSAWGTWDDVESGGFNDNNNQGRNSDDKKNSWGGSTWDASDGGKSKPNLDNKKESWNDGKTQQWNGPLWGEVEAGKSSGNTTKWDGPDLNETADASQWKSDTGVSSKELITNSSHVKHSFDLNSDDTLPEDETPQVVTSGADSIQSVGNMTSPPLPSLNGPTLESKKEGDKLVKPSEIGDLNEPQKGQVPPVYSDLNLTNAIDFLKSLPNDTRPKDEHKTSVPIGILSDSVRQENQMSESDRNPERRVTEHAKQEEEKVNPDSSEAQGKVEEGDDEKALRQFKMSLVELVKEILKPKWKDGVLTREVYKTVVKKVVEKVATSIHGNQIPRPQTKVDQYLAYSKPKITKLVEAYVEKHLKA